MKLSRETQILIEQAALALGKACEEYATDVVKMRQQAEKGTGSRETYNLMVKEWVKERGTPPTFEDLVAIEMDAIARVPDIMEWALEEEFDLYRKVVQIVDRRREKWLNSKNHSHRNTNLTN